MDILNRSGTLAKIQLILACLFFFPGIIFFPQPCRADTVKVDVRHSRDQYSAGRSYQVIFNVRISNQWYIHGTRKISDFIIPTVLSFSELSGIRVEEIKFPEPEKKKFEYSEEPVEVFSGEIEVSASLVISEKAPIGKQVLNGQLSFQACSLRACMPPEKVPVRINLSIVSPEKNEKPERPAVLESEKDDSVSKVPVPGWMAGAGFWLTLFGLFLGGLALNLTPCIYPLIPITVSYFGGKSGGTKGKTIFHGVLYILGLAFTNSILGVFASLSGGMLGSALQNPIVLIVVAGILVSLGLSFFRTMGNQGPLRPDQVSFKKLRRILRDLFYGSHTRDRGRALLRPFSLRSSHLCGPTGRPFFRVPLFLCPEHRARPSPCHTGRLFRGTGKAARVRCMDGVDQKGLRVGPCGHGGISITALNARCLREINAFCRHPGCRRSAPWLDGEGQGGLAGF